LINIADIFKKIKNRFIPSPEQPKTSDNLLLDSDEDIEEYEIEASGEISDDIVTFHNPQSFEAEQFKMLRAKLLFPVSGRPPRSIMVTSPAPEEGKTFICANLAVSIAQNIDKYVFLMDCDLRRPNIHKFFGYEDVPGLSEYLSYGTHFDEANPKEFISVPGLNEYLNEHNVFLSSLLLKTQLKRLTILPGGMPPDNPSELLSSNKMIGLLKEVTSKYGDRCVLIDSPPPNLMPETSVIARQVDGVIIVIKYGSTTQRMVDQLIEIIGRDKVMGIIINWFDTRSSTYNLYHKYVKRK
jgi:protein-tyrosine kinase